VYPDFPRVNPVAFVVPSVKVVGNVDEVSTDGVVNAVVLTLDRTLQFAPTLPIVIVPAFVPPIANVPELLTASIDGVNKLVFTFVVPKIVKLLPWILPVADIVALDTAPDAVNELPEIAPVVVSVVPVIALVETKLLPVILPVADIVALDTAPDAVNELPEIAPVVVSVVPVMALVETKLLPVILPVADIVALDTAPDAVNELPEIAPVVVSVVPVIAPDEDTVAPDRAPVAVMLLPVILPVVEIDGSVIVLLNTTGDLKVVIILP